MRLGSLFDGSGTAHQRTWMTEARKAKGLSMEQAADLADTSKTEWFRIEKGTCEPKVMRAWRICEVLGEPMERWGSDGQADK